MEIGLGNLIGLYGLLALIPLIILYLRKPKPIDKMIPSLMFLMSENKARKKFSFFRNLVRNLLLLLQILMLSVLALSLAEPFADLPLNASINNNVIVLDGSASSQTRLGDSTRFNKIVNEAKKYVNNKVSIILASDMPVTLLEDGSKRDALAILNSVKPTDTTTNIEGAMMEAENVLKKEKGNIYVISDFITTEESDQPFKAKRFLTALSHNVKFVEVSSKADNVGIVDLTVNKYETKVYVKNYNDEKVSVPVRVIVDTTIVKEVIVDVLPDSIETLKFKTEPGVSRIELDRKDDLDVDNKAYISTPPNEKIKVLMITNVDASYIMSAIKASKNVEMEIRKPPIVKAFDMDHDVIMIDNVKETIVPSDVKDMVDYVGTGKGLVITAQQDIDKAGLRELYPVEFKGISNSTKACVKIFNYITKRFENEDGGCFTKLGEYFVSALKDDKTLTLVEADDNSSIITITDKGKGKIVYYGILDEFSDFKSNENYPIFWDNVINFLMGSEDISVYNKRFDYKGSKRYDKVGVYDEGDIKVAMNLLNEKESKVFIESDIEESEKRFIVKSGEKSFNFSLVVPMMILTSILLLAELFYIKMRGDL
tara:strand:+ start:7578 stop:9368 length:1791 start_codon:yes stop_codon:yes gene_type:complete